MINYLLSGTKFSLIVFLCVLTPGMILGCGGKSANTVSSQIKNAQKTSKGIKDVAKKQGISPQRAAYLKRVLGVFIFVESFNRISEASEGYQPGLPTDIQYPQLFDQKNFEEYRKNVSSDPRGYEKFIEFTNELLRKNRDETTEKETSSYRYPPDFFDEKEFEEQIRLEQFNDDTDMETFYRETISKPERFSSRFLDLVRPDAQYFIKRKQEEKKD